MKSRLVIWVLFVACLSACDAVSVRHTPADKQPEDQVEACPPLTYAENPTDAVSALPVQFQRVTYSNMDAFREHAFQDGVTVDVDGLKFQSLITCPEYIGNIDQCNHQLFAREPTNQIIYFSKDGQEYSFQTFLRFRYRLKEYPLAESNMVNGRMWFDMSIAIKPTMIPKRPWFLLIQDRDCSSRAEYASEGLIQDFNYLGQTTKPVFSITEGITNPTVGRVTISWHVFRMPADAWFYLGFITEATELVMSSGEDSKGSYLAFETRYYGDGLTVVEQCGRVYDPAVTDFVQFKYIPNNEQRTLFNGVDSETVERPLRNDVLSALAYWWNRRHGGLPIDSTPLLIPESLISPLIPWYSATVHIGSCSRTLRYYVNECEMSYHFQPSSIQSCDAGYYLEGLPAYRLQVGENHLEKDDSPKSPENYWSLVLGL